MVSAVAVTARTTAYSAGNRLYPITVIYLWPLIRLAGHFFI